jgi:hypothetical protein
LSLKRIPPVQLRLQKPISQAYRSSVITGFKITELIIHEIFRLIGEKHESPIVKRFIAPFWQYRNNEVDLIATGCNDDVYLLGRDYECQYFTMEGIFHEGRPNEGYVNDNDRTFTITFQGNNAEGSPPEYGDFVPNTGIVKRISFFSFCFEDSENYHSIHENLPYKIKFTDSMQDVKNKLGLPNQTENTGEEDKYKAIWYPDTIKLHDDSWRKLTVEIIYFDPPFFKFGQIVKVDFSLTKLNEEETEEEDRKWKVVVAEAIRKAEENPDDDPFSKLGLPTKL